MIRNFFLKILAKYASRWVVLGVDLLLVSISFLLAYFIRFSASLQFEVAQLWKPMHQQPIFDNYPAYTNGVSDDLFDKGLCLPSGSNLTKEDLNRVIVIIKNSLNA